MNSCLQGLRVLEVRFLCISEYTSSPVLATVLVTAVQCLLWSDEKNKTASSSRTPHTHLCMWVPPERQGLKKMRQKPLHTVHERWLPSYPGTLWQILNMFNVGSLWDTLVGEHTCHQDWCPKFNPQNSHGVLSNSHMSAMACTRAHICRSKGSTLHDSLVWN